MEYEGLKAKAEAMFNGNFYKLLSLVLTVLLFVVSLLQQTNYSRLEERIAAIQSALGTAIAQQSTARSETRANLEKLADRYANLNAEVQSYRMLPAQVVGATKSIEDIRAQMNMVLYRVLGKAKGDGM